jgi:hypothetical protein
MFWADLPRSTDVMRADMPQLRFMLRARQLQLRQWPDVRPPEVALDRADDGGDRASSRGPLMVFGIALLPAGWAALVREDASSHADGLVDGTAMFGPLLADAMDAMRSRRPLDVMAGNRRCGDARARGRERRSPAVVHRMTDQWLTGSASPEVDTLVASAGMSPGRSNGWPAASTALRPSCSHANIGAAGGLAARIGQSFVAGRRRGRFYDQSHFIREVKHFTGLTPRQLLRDPPPVTKLMSQRRAMTGHLSELAL